MTNEGMSNAESAFEIPHLSFPLTDARPRSARLNMIAPRTCPICDAAIAPDVSPEGTSAADKAFPFCSERCRNVDLYRWSQGSYAITEPLTPDRLLHELGDDPEAVEQLFARPNEGTGDGTDANG